MDQVGLLLHSVLQQLNRNAAARIDCLQHAARVRVQQLRRSSEKGRQQAHDLLPQRRVLPSQELYQDSHKAGMGSARAGVRVEVVDHVVADRLHVPLRDGRLLRERRRRVHICYPRRHAADQVHLCCVRRCVAHCVLLRRSEDGHRKIVEHLVVEGRRADEDKGREQLLKPLGLLKHALDRRRRRLKARKRLRHRGPRLVAILGVRQECVHQRELDALRETAGLVEAKSLVELTFHVPRERLGLSLACEGIRIVIVSGAAERREVDVLRPKCVLQLRGRGGAEWGQRRKLFWRNLPGFDLDELHLLLLMRLPPSCEGVSDS
mmetsp:Transcript_12918/g.47868  ORF Transcript_12918/g.47868 Transcript_12918/m.47868 type:complete len:321 (-) Transcript_12918:1973-2935(-)